ncbi:MAG: hypothetical protein IT262_10790, partial [Saprospiraceae bacterium]|nr:hypothetical protein [Saprospiraceae bacterium]
MLFQYKSLFAALLLGMLSQAAFAQKELEGDNVTVIKDFDARLLESNKLSVPPSLPPLDTNTQLQNYVVPPRPLTLNYEAPKLRPIGMKAGKKEESFNGYAKAGAGVPKSFWGEVGYFFASKDKFDGKAWFRHHSMDASKNVDNQRFANNDFLLNGNYYINEQLAAEAKVGVSADRVHFYGYDHDSLSFSKEGSRQNFNLVTVGGRLYNKERNETDLNFSVAPQVYVLNDYYSNKESGFDLNLSATKWFAEKHPLRLAIRTDMTKFTDSITQKLNNIYLQPSFTFHSDVVKIKIGGNFASNRDVFSVFPDAEITLRVFGDGIQIFGGANGDLRKNTYRSMSEYSPFLQIRETKLKNTRFDNYYAGVKGNLGWLDYTGQVNYSKASDLALFQTQYTSTGVTRFQALYDTVKISNIQGTIKFSPIKNLTVTGTLSQNFIMDPSNQSKAWGLPKLEGNFGAT